MHIYKSSCYDYKTIDISKFILSFFVIAIHVDYFIQSPLNLHFIWNLAVPLFFIFSGFFLYKGYRKGGISKIDSYIYKLIKLYILYTIIYFPLSYIDFRHSDYSWIVYALNYIRRFFFVGEQAWSWPLWYLLGLIIATLILRLLLKKNIAIIKILIIGIILTFIGLLINFFNGKDIPIINQFIYIYNKIFTTTRNGIFIGFGYVSIGFFIAHFENKLTQYSKLFYLLFIVFFIGSIFNIVYSLNIAASMLACILIPKTIYHGENNIWLRNMSTLIYFFHMYTIALIYIILHYFSIKLSFVTYYAITCIITTIYCAYILNFMRYKHFSFLKNLLG